MTTLEWEILALAVVVAVTCALPGVFLVLRRMALMSDAISHSILLGIVLAFFVVHDLTSPLLVLAAAATGVVMVALVELLHATRRVKEDAAIALVFPALFSVAVLLIARHAGDVHLDVDAVLLGEIAFAPFRRLEWGGRDLGPRGLWLMGGILLLNAAFLVAFYKELKVSTFDAGLAAAMGFSPVLLHYAFMSVVSVTAVGAFDAVGSILVVALMIAPPAAARLLTDRLGRMLGLSALLAALSAVAGFFLARGWTPTSPAPWPPWPEVVFLLCLLVSPDRGVAGADPPESSAVGVRPPHAHHPPPPPRGGCPGGGGEPAGSSPGAPPLVPGLRPPKVALRAEREGHIQRERDGRLRFTPLGRESARHFMAHDVGGH
jgi:manganese/zinc/iron transport system permease protein